MPPLATCPASWRVRKCTRNSIRPMQRTRQQPTTRPLQRAALSQQKKAMRLVQGLILKQDDPNNIALPLLNYSADATELYSVDATELYSVDAPTTISVDPNASGYVCPCSAFTARFCNLN